MGCVTVRVEPEETRNLCNFRSNYLCCEALGRLLDKKQAKGGATALRLQPLPAVAACSKTALALMAQECGSISITA